ncbi:ROK family transcriptional regulator [Lachnospiraceae bacterium oral taxon 500]|nr:ROK family transcriptional regulator [Lachnospiraceae bacterium oral taxon 500]
MEILTVHQKGKSQIKSKNRLKIFKLILSSGGISRIELGKSLHLSAASVTRAVEELVRAGLVYEEKKEITFVGRRPVLLNIRKNSCYSMGIHISRRSISLCIHNLLEEVVYEAKDSIGGVEYAVDLLRVLHQMMNRALEKSGISKEKIVSVGLAVRGIVNRQRGTVIYSEQTQEIIPIVESVKSLFDSAVFLENNIDVDLKSAYSQEFPHTDELVYVFADEGISGGMISGRQVIRGRNNMAAQFAHLLVEENGRLCSCGQKGHLQPYLAKSAIEAEYQSQSGQTGVNLVQICDRADQGEEIARAVLHTALEKLAAAMAQVIVLFNPGVIVLCGDIFEHYPDGVPFLRDTVAARVPIPPLLNFDWRVRIRREIRPERNVAKLALEYLLEQ